MTFATRMKRRRAQRRVSRGLTAEQLAVHELTASRTLTVADGSRVEDGDKVTLEMFTVETIIKHIKAGRIWIDPLPPRRPGRLAYAKPPKPSPEPAPAPDTVQVQAPVKSAPTMSAAELLAQLDTSCTVREIRAVLTKLDIEHPTNASKGQLLAIAERVRT